MSKLWTIPSLFVVTGIFAAACSPSGEVSGTEPESSIVSKLPLSEGCSACAGDVIGAECGAALDACQDNESCLDVPGCFEGCAPDDGACFAQCAAASALFEDLVGCVVCDACADACDGEWSCGDGGEGDGDEEDGDGDGDGGDGGDGGDDGECPDGAEGEDCKPGDGDGGNDGECPDGAEGEDCKPGDGDGDGGDDGECPDGEDCKPGDGEGEGGLGCFECVKSGTEGECAELVEACMGNEGCRWVAECIAECGDDPACGQHCLEEGANVDFVHGLLECAVCGQCADACPADPYCG